MARNYNVALVGCGTISYNHLTALSKLDNVKVVALCDTKPEKAEARRAEFGLESKIYTDYAEMLAAEKLDAVHICTPHYLHAPMTIAALERDIYVCLEKPMCINREEIKALLEAEKKSRASVTVSFQTRYNKANMIAKKIAEEDGIISAYCSNFWQRTNEYYTESGWRGAYATEGGGVMINQAIHNIDHLIGLLGKPVALYATKSNHKHKGIIEVEDTCEGVITFESGMRANFYATTAADGYDDTSVVIRTENHKIILDLPNVTVDGVMTSYENDTHYVGKRCYGNGHVQLIARFYDALKNGNPMPVSAESAQYALKIILAAYKSHDKEIII